MHESANLAVEKFKKTKYLQTLLESGTIAARLSFTFRKMPNLCSKARACAWLLIGVCGGKRIAAEAGRALLPALDNNNIIPIIKIGEDI